MFNIIYNPILRTICFFIILLLWFLFFENLKYLFEKKVFLVRKLLIFMFLLATIAISCFCLFYILQDWFKYLT